ncbi:MAG TPA: PAS domain S-box protein [Nitrospirae bacterium]|nr:PAS domain S-box protein [Nitrospirota bacterium]
MDDEKKTREQLMAELVDLRVAESDIRKLFELVVRAKQEWEAVADSISDIICLIDDKGLIVRANLAVEKWNLCNVKEVKGMSVHELLHDTCNDRDCYLASFWPHAMEALSSGRGSEIEGEDKILNVHLSVKPLPMSYNSDKHMVENAFAVVIIEDITERNKALSALKSSEEKYRDLFENANDLIQSVAADSSFLYVNRAWREALGYDEEEVARLSFTDIIHPDDMPRCIDAFKCLMAGEEIGKFEVTFITKNGLAIELEGSVNCQYKDGRPIGTRGIFRDITKRKELENELKKKIDELERFHKVVVGREMRMKELKNRIKELEDELGKGQ